MGGGIALGFRVLVAIIVHSLRSVHPHPNSASTSLQTSMVLISPKHYFAIYGKQ